MTTTRSGSPRTWHWKYNMRVSCCVHFTIVVLAVCSFLRQATSSPMPYIGHHSGPSSKKWFTTQKTYWMQVAGASCAAATMVASCVAFFWFWRMEKRFRHRLIVLVIFGDMMKATWMFLFAVVSIARGTVHTESAFCQASGFLVQYGTETSDYAVLVIAIHSAMQVFRRSNTIRSDGLYPYRYPLFVGAFLIPILMSALPFAGDQHGYMSQGAFCSLPIRPFWYRLALAWIPRYIIAIIILGLAVVIYAHVGFEFRSFSGTLQNEKPSVSTITPMVSMHDHTIFPRRGSSIVSFIGASRRASVVASASMCSENDDNTGLASIENVPQSHRDSNAYTIPPGTRDTKSRPDTTNSRNYSSTKYENLDRPAPPNPSDARHTNAVQSNLVKQRIRIHRQLRLLFVYPICYIFMWLIPFVSHCLMYYEKWAAHPLYGLVLASTVCLNSMGIVDCLIFTLRERPWRHIPDSDGTFLGSFACWRTFSRSSHATANEPATVPSTCPTNRLHRTTTEGNPKAAKRPSRENGPLWGILGKGWRSSGGSDHARVQAKFARIRLDAEMEERRAANSIERQ